jgi:hypothetical protein
VGRTVFGHQRDHYGTRIPGYSYTSLFAICFAQHTHLIDKVCSVFDPQESYYRVKSKQFGYHFYAWHLGSQVSYIPVDIDVPVKIVETLDFVCDPQLKAAIPRYDEYYPIELATGEFKIWREN